MSRNTTQINSKIPNKSKGSGLGMYIDNDFQFNRIENFCGCTENLESLFIEVTSTDTPQIIGVIYRPPSGNENTFHEEFDDLLRELPSENVHIKSRANILTRAQSKAYTEPSSFSSLFNLPYSKDIHYFSQARHIAHSTTQCRKLYLYYYKL